MRPLKVGFLALSWFLAWAACLHAEPVAPNGAEYRAVEGDWVVLGRHTSDGGFSCSMSHVTPGGVYTVFTGLQVDPEFVHQSLFIPWSGEAAGLRASVEEGSEPVPTDVVGGMAVVPLTMLQLRMVVGHLEAQTDLPVSMIPTSGGTVLERFPSSGAPRAMAKQAECISLMRPRAD